ncbi:LytR/AlgR family response regulator transcription factor [Algoriphagus formosus]|uniref:LytR/AlgR family response regulator transcription factor n=1 Tax=Algoriphagus formosus TaxID=2007308 RepID=UPI003F716118
MNLKFWSKPHPFIFDWKSVLIPGLVTFLILGIYAPFGLGEMEDSWRWGFAASISAVAASSIWGMVTLLRAVVSQEYLDEKWTLGNEILLILSVLLLICLLVFIAFVSLGFSDQPIVDVFKDVVLKTLLASFLPVVILVLTEQYLEQRKQLKNIKSLAAHFPKESSEAKKDPTFPASNHLIILENENGKPLAKLPAEEIILFQSEGNYLEVFHLSKEDELRKTLIRNTLKTYVKRLPAEDFFHAHKRFLVNRHRIKELRGNSRNYEIRLESFPDWVPVSRSKSQDLLAYFKS